MYEKVSIVEKQVHFFTKRKLTKNVVDVNEEVFKNAKKVIIGIQVNISLVLMDLYYENKISNSKEFFIYKKKNGITKTKRLKFKNFISSLLRKSLRL